jgi:hypothetical protein
MGGLRNVMEQDLSSAFEARMRMIDMRKTDKKVMEWAKVEVSLRVCPKLPSRPRPYKLPTHPHFMSSTQ